MKKLLLFVIVGFSSLLTFAQETPTLKTYDQVLPRFCIDADYKYGVLNQDYSSLSLTAFTNNIKGATVVSQPKFTNGISNGGDISVGYFFGKKRMFGIGLGIMYLSQKGKATMDSFHIEYQSTDNVKNAEGVVTHSIFRQTITSDNASLTNNPGKITENITTSNFNIPLMLKFKHQFSRKIGISADLGALINIGSSYSYNTNAKFDYGAIYTPSGNTFVFDNATTPVANDFLITKENYLAHNPNGNIDQYFAVKANDGYNVGLQVQPTNNKATTKYDVGVGGMIQAGITYEVSYRVSLMLGGYYMYQVFNQKNSDSWQLTNTVGNYSSMLDGVKQTTYSSYGLNIGIRYFIGGFEDRDGDGIADTKDGCPLIPGLEKFNGCPDADGDGIADHDDACPLEAGPICTGGCPDRDNDCVADKYDNCPDEAGSPQLSGCPDKDGDGVPDKFDRCPDEPGTADNSGCPLDELIASVLKKDSTYIKNQHSGTWEPPHIVLSSYIINYNFGNAKMSKESDAMVNEAVDVMNKNPKVMLCIAGYTDNVGGIPGNIVLSYERAENVKAYLVSKGIAKERIIVSANGKSDPLNNNKTAEDRAKNRRIEMKVLLPLQ